MEERVEFRSAGLKIAGVLQRPKDARPGERRPAFLVLHGFGSNKMSSNCILPCKMLADWGYAALRFDFRGCGESEGTLRAALTARAPTSIMRSPSTR